MYYYPMMSSGDWFYMLLLTIFGILFLTALALVVIRLSKGGAEPEAARVHKALDIAKERYAKGELTKVEFEQLKKDLSE